jgi:hypothetical protein
MKFAMTTFWSGPGNVSVEAGTIFDANDHPDWWPLPLTAKALDQEALNMISGMHPFLQPRQFAFAQGLRPPHSPSASPPPHRGAPERAALPKLTWSAGSRVLMLHDFHLGNAIAAGGTEVDWSQSPWCDVPIPLTVRALSQVALDCLCLQHGEEAYHLLHYERGLRLPAKGFPPAAPGRAAP